MVYVQNVLCEFIRYRTVWLVHVHDVWEHLVYWLGLDANKGLLISYFLLYCLAVCRMVSNRLDAWIVTVSVVAHRIVGCFLEGVVGWMAEWWHAVKPRWLKLIGWLMIGWYNWMFIGWTIEVIKWMHDLKLLWRLVAWISWLVICLSTHPFNESVRILHLRVWIVVRVEVSNGLICQIKTI